VLLHTAWALQASMHLRTADERPSTSLPATSHVQSIAVGQSIPALGLQHDKWSDVNAVLFFRRDCVYCKASLHFYRDLATLKDVSSGRFRLIVVGPDSVSDVSEMLQANRIQPDSIQSLPLTVAGVSGTPTLALLDVNGVIRRLWTGQLQQSEERQALDWIQKFLKVTH